MEIKWTNEYYRLKNVFEIIDNLNFTLAIDGGCGNGLLELKYPDKNIIGIDISEISLKTAKNKNPKGNFIMSSIDSIPIRENSVDLFTLIAVLGGLSENSVDKTFEDINKLTKANGKIVIVLYLCTTGIGFFIAKLFKLSIAKAKTIAIEVGLQNGVLAMVIAMTIIESTAISIPAIVYTVLGTAFTIILTFYFRLMFPSNEVGKEEEIINTI